MVLNNLSNVVADALRLLLVQGLGKPDRRQRRVAADEEHVRAPAIGLLSRSGIGKR